MGLRVRLKYMTDVTESLGLQWGRQRGVTTVV